MLKFVPNEPALVLGDYLVISDLHLGFEFELRRKGIRIPLQTLRVADRVVSLLERTNSSRLLINGDLKHEIGASKERMLREIGLFFATLKKATDSITLIPGNHDGDISRAVKDVEISDEKIIAKTSVLHGHKWPSVKAFNQEKMVIAHNHPVVEFRDRFGGRVKEKAWIAGQLNSEEIVSRYGLIRNLPEVYIMPAFSEVSGGCPVQSCNMGPIAKRINLPFSKVYLLDGTYLGEVRHMGEKKI